MTYPFFILLGLLVVSGAVGGWYIVMFRKRVDRLYGEGEITGDTMAGEIVRRLGRIETHLEKSEPRLEHLETAARASVQKVGFVRFNPFQDTGGDNSFILTLLDAENTGVMVCSLFTREGVRVYGKAIAKGRSRHQLSQEEKRALEEVIGKKITHNT